VANRSQESVPSGERWITFDPALRGGTDLRPVLAFNAPFLTEQSQTASQRQYRTIFQGQSAAVRFGNLARSTNRFRAEALVVRTERTGSRCSARPGPSSCTLTIRGRSAGPNRPLPPFVSGRHQLRYESIDRSCSSCTYPPEHDPARNNVDRQASFRVATRLTRSQC
jgi:hypothetical protein